MITIFNREEVLNTYDIKRQADARSILAQNGIDYVVNTRTPHNAYFGSGGRAHTGTFGMDMEHYYEYRIYVHRKDCEKAAALIGR